MTRKSYYRDFLIECKPFIKLSVFAKMVDLNPSTLSLFLRTPDNDYMISESKLMQLTDLITSTIRNFA